MSPIAIKVAGNLLIFIATPTGGEKFSSIDLETKLETHPAIAEAGVVAVADEEWGERPVAFVTVKSGAHIHGQEVIEWAKNNSAISKFMVPREVVVVAKVRPSKSMDIEQLTRAMDDLDRRIRRALPLVADVFIDVTASGAEDHRVGDREEDHK